MSEPVKPSEMKESPYTKFLAEMATEKMGVANSIRPVEKGFMRAVDQMNTPGQYDRAGALAQSGVVQQYSPVVQEAQGKLIQSGIAPNSGAYVLGMNRLRNTGAEAMAQSALGGRLGQQDRYVAGQQSIMNIGNGQSALAQNGMENVAGQALDQAKQRISQKWAEKSAAVQGVGNLAGMLARGGLALGEK